MIHAMNTKDTKDTKDTIYQQAGEIIMNRYNDVKDIPKKYMFLYTNYIPLSIGVKRKFEEAQLYNNHIKN
jgi:hypothetical protein